MKDLIKINKVLISVSDKRRVSDLALQLIKYKASIYSTGNTYKELKSNNLPVSEISDLTKFPEILDGRLKTLHPKVHGGLLGIKNNKKHIEQMKKYDIQSIDLLIVNLYPFLETIKKSNKLNECIENIDIGGPAMIRSAAKNHESVCVVTDPKDYKELLKCLDKNNGFIDLNIRQAFAAKAFAYTAYYDSIISNCNILPR